MVYGLIPQEMFFVKGVGVHKDKLVSFEAALRSAGIEKCNLVHVSSIFPPQCKLIGKKRGIACIEPGQIVFCVMARNSTSEPNRLVSAAVGLAVPTEVSHHGYLSEHQAFGETARVSGEYAEDLAATMLATTLGIPFDPNQDWNEQKRTYETHGRQFVTHHICQAAAGDKDGLWTTVIAAAIFVM